MTAVFHEIKKKRREKDLFGEHVYIASQPISRQTHEREAWAKEFRHHGMVMRNTGKATFAGLEYPDAETEIVRFELATGDSRLSTTTRMTTSVRKLLYKLKV